MLPLRIRPIDHAYARNIRDAELLRTEGLNENIIRYQRIEAFKSLATSPNAKVIITDGTTPFLIQGEGASKP